MNRTASRIVFLMLLFVVVAGAQTRPSPAGHWEGSMNLPSGDVIKVVVDLDKDAAGAWIGDIDIPDRGVKDIALRVSISNDSVSFQLPPESVGPKFAGRLAVDGSTITGNFTQAESTIELVLKRTGEAKVYVPPRNASLPEKFAGKWEGSLEAMGTALRLAFNLANKGDAANGTIDSLDQNAMGIPMDEISVAENQIKILVKMVQASYSGKLSEDGKTLTGEWSQGGNTLPLVLKKAVAK